ncbi:hypothetical protein OUZ56_000985 [Daphnia magna]|uniref:Uncharacterized protein n=1 Tax=Daphnia magna TaxID=35525 RepID=A0ABR0A1B6_9CRUS|nr:hypothetical protein OUZ56_000985 [Daphnia magna]
MSEEKDLSIDMAAKEEAKSKCRKGSRVDDTIAFNVHAITKLLKKGFPRTDDFLKYNYKGVSDEVDSPYARLSRSFRRLSTKR